MILATLALVAGFALPGALAGPDAATVRTEGATIRLLAGAPDAEGQVRGAVLFDLEPGWKTYWRDPGASGLPPEVEFEGFAQEASELLFPVPQRLREGDEPFNGYEAPVAFAFRAPAPATGELALTLHAGLCREICVPVSVRLSRDLAQPLQPAETSAVERAFLSLPVDRGETLAGRIEGDTLVVERTGENASDLFVSGPSGWGFGPAGNDATDWRIPIRTRPGDEAAPARFEAVVADGGSGRAVRIEMEPSTGAPRGPATGREKR